MRHRTTIMIVTTDNKVVLINRKSLIEGTSGEAPSFKEINEVINRFGYYGREINRLGTIINNDEIIHPFLSLQTVVISKTDDALVEIELEEFYDSVLLGLIDNIHAMLTALAAAPRLDWSFARIPFGQMAYKPGLPGHPSNVKN